MGEQCLVMIDGVDFAIQKPTLFDTRWYSHKFDGPGIRYEIAVCIHTRDIMLFTGPFECGTWPDRLIFRHKLKQMLGPNEKVIADRGYKGKFKVVTPYDPLSEDHGKLMNTARARHETINGRLKVWMILKYLFRHPLVKHHIAFRAVLVLEQIEIENGHRPFQVQDHNDPM
jgi:DDE superfamily endonuclease